MTDKDINGLFAKLIRLSLGLADEFPDVVSAEAWERLYRLAQQETLIGLCWQGVSRLGREQQPPLELSLRWASEAEQISGLNKLLNAEAARLTQLFAQAGRRSAVLKGQANARLYPNPLSRQPGDIDIWVEGDRESVVNLLISLGMLDKPPVAANLGQPGKPRMSYHHVHLPPTKDGVVVEAHFRPSSGNYNPITNRRLQRWLTNDLETGITTTEAGFCMPSVRFALLMQLAHIQHHFLGRGLGMRQIVDYHLLLRSATEAERRETSASLGRFGLSHAAGALMWVLREVLHADEGVMLCPPDERRGRMLLGEVMEGGNFGCYSERQQYGMWKRFLKARQRRLWQMRFDFWEAFWIEVHFWVFFMGTLPVRIKYRTLSLKGLRG